MIVKFSGKTSELDCLFEIIQDCGYDDFYLTKENQRLFIKEKKSLKKLLKESHNVFFEDRHNNKGIVLIWKSSGGDKTRNYIKLVASNLKEAKGLLTMLLWNYSKELYVKIKKNSPFIEAYKERGFKLIGLRGEEILFCRPSSLGD